MAECAAGEPAEGEAMTEANGRRQEGCDSYSWRSLRRVRREESSEGRGAHTASRNAGAIAQPEVRNSLLVERCDRNHDRLGKPGVGLILKFPDGRVRHPSRHCFAFKRQIGWRRF